MPAQIERNRKTLLDKGKGLSARADGKDTILAVASMDDEAVESMATSLEARLAFVSDDSPRRTSRTAAHSVNDDDAPAELEESAQAWLRRAGKVKLLTHDEEKKLAIRMEVPQSARDAEDAKNVLVMSN